MIIYEPKGKALEYSPLAANLYKGCSHACVYCFAPSATFCDRNKFSSPDYISVRKNALIELEKDAKKINGDHRKILLSFTSDPYQPIEKDLNITREALKILLENNLTPQILTKAGSWPVKRDAILLRKSKAVWAATLTTDDDNESLLWEPGAALPKDRLKGLWWAKKLGLQTWVSFEPVINPDAVYRLIKRSHEYVNLYKVGKLNYHPLAKEIDWKKFLKTSVSILESLNKKYYIKKDLAVFG